MFKVLGFIFFSLFIFACSYDLNVKDVKCTNDSGCPKDYVCEKETCVLETNLDKCDKDSDCKDTFLCDSFFDRCRDNSCIGDKDCDIDNGEICSDSVCALMCNYSNECKDKSRPLCNEDGECIECQEADCNGHGTCVVKSIEGPEYREEESCECNPHFTSSSFTSSNFCDVCELGYEGDNCDSCGAGLVMNNLGECVECLSNSDCANSIKTVCDLSANTCICELGYIGDNCDECDTDYTMFNNECRKLKIFVTASSFTGDLGGIEGADQKCNNDENTPSNIKRHYKALLGSFLDRKLDIDLDVEIDWPLEANLSYFRATGVKIGDTNSEKKLIFPLLTGVTDVSTEVWSGFNDSNINFVLGSSTCRNWTDGTSVWKGFFGQGVKINKDMYTTAIPSGCDASKHIYCVEQVCPENLIWSDDKCVECSSRQKKCYSQTSYIECGMDGLWGENPITCVGNNDVCSDGVCAD